MLLGGGIAVTRRSPYFDTYNPHDIDGVGFIEDLTLSLIFGENHIEIISSISANTILFELNASIHHLVDFST